MDGFRRGAHDLREGCAEFVIQLVVILIGLSIVLFFAVISGTLLPGP